MIVDLITDENIELFQDICNYLVEIWFILYLIFILIWVIVFIRWFLKDKKNTKFKSSKDAPLWFNQYSTKFILKKNLRRSWELIKYPTIWLLIGWTAWMQVALIFWNFDSSLNWYLINRDLVPNDLNAYYSVSALVSFFLIFISAYIIWLSFGKKWIRAIWDLIYIIWLLLPIILFLVVCWYQ